MNRLDVSSVKTGMRFSKPVFFDDGKNMFIESGIAVKPYHISAITRWNVPYLLTNGHPLEPGEEVSADDEIQTLEEVEEIADIDGVEDAESVEDIEDIAEIEDAEELGDIEEL